MFLNMFKNISILFVVLSFFISCDSTTRDSEIDIPVYKKESSSLKPSGIKEFKIDYFDKKDDGGWGYTTSGTTASTTDLAGNIYFVGTFWDKEKFETDFIIIKVSKNGDEVWRHTYKDPKGTNIVAEAIAVDKNENIYVTGVSTIGGYTMDTDRDIMTMKIDSKGNALWLNIEDTKYFSNSTSIILDKDGNIVIAGRLDHKHKSKTSLDTCTIFIIKYTTDGKLLYSRENSNLSFNRKIYDIHMDSKEDIFLSGSLFAVGEKNKYRSFITKIDKAGNIIWDRDLDEKSIRVLMKSDKELYKVAIPNIPTKDQVTLSIIKADGKEELIKSFTINQVQTVDAIEQDNNGLFYIATKSSNTDEEFASEYKEEISISLLSKDEGLINSKKYDSGITLVENISKYEDKLYISGSQYSDNQPRFKGYSDISSGSGNLFLMIDQIVK